MENYKNNLATYVPPIMLQLYNYVHFHNVIVKSRKISHKNNCTASVFAPRIFLDNISTLKLNFEKLKPQFFNLHYKV